MGMPPLRGKHMQTRSVRTAQLPWLFCVSALLLIAAPGLAADSIFDDNWVPPKRKDPASVAPAVPGVPAQVVPAPAATNPAPTPPAPGIPAVPPQPAVVAPAPPPVARRAIP